MKKNAKGITLVAMVITIIVMLILAGVSISMVTGDNGVLTNAQEGSVKTNLSSVESAIGLSITSNQTEYMAQFAESTAAAGSKQEYLTIDNLNEFCDGVKLLGAENTTSDKSHNFKLKGADSGINIKATKAYGPGSSLAKACTIYKKDGNDAQKEGTSTKASTSAPTTSGYNTTIFYFSDGANATTIGTNLYVVAVHFEKGFFKIDDIGVIKSKAPTGTTIDLNQGALYSAAKSDLDKLTIEWLKEAKI